MKKLFIVCLLVSSLFFVLKPIKGVNAEIDLDLNTETYVLIEPNSKKVILEKNAHEKMYPASMTKMMGLYLILEAIESNKISLDDEVLVSSYAASMGGTQIYLEENEKMPLEDLLKAVAINSANDAIVALGEHLAHSNANFIKMMNDKAKEFKMNDTHFVNATGFDDENHYTSCYDMAILGSNLLSFGNKILKYTSLSEAYIRENSDNPFWLVNTNKLLKYYEGMDGLKTGYTKDAGYNLTATALRNGVRFVSVVMHEETIENRSQDTIRLLDYGFSKYRCMRLFEKNTIIKDYKLKSYDEKVINLIVKDDVDIVMLKEEKKEDLKIEIEVLKQEPPLSKDEIIGKLIVTTSEGMEYFYNLYTDKEVKNESFFKAVLNNIFSFFFA